MIKVRGVCKQYGEKKAALKDVSFQVPQGETCALVGLDGEGKTTLMDILSGVMECEKGRIEIGGCDMVEHPYEAKRHVGYVPAVPPVYRDMTPRRSIRFVADAWGMGGREAADRVDEVLKTTQLVEVSDTPCRNLNDSTLRMVALAQALVTDPEVLLVDEPTDGLDVKDAIEMRKVLSQVAGKKTVLLATCNLSDVKALCSRVLVLSDKQIVADAQADRLHELELNTNGLCVRVAGAEEAAQKAIAGVKGAQLISAEAANEVDACDLVIEQQGDLRAQISTALVQAGLPILQMNRQTVSGEQLLRKLAEERVTLDEKGDVPDDESGM